MDRTFGQGNLRGVDACYSGNGGFLFLSQGRSTKKISCPALTVVADFTLEDIGFAQADRTGRHLFSGCGGSLFDTVLQREACLPNQSRTSVDRGRLLYSSLDENEILYFTADYRDGRYVLYVSHYAGLLDKIYLKSRQETIIDLEMRIWVNVNIKKAVMVSPSGEIHRISIDEDIELLDSTADICGYAGQAIFISQDCSQWESIHYGYRKTVVRIFATNNPDAEPRRHELEPPSRSCNFVDTRISMSSDLSVLVVNHHIYTLTSLDDQTASKAITSMKLNGLVLGRDEWALKNPTF